MLVAANWQLRRDKQGVIEPVSPNVWDSFFKKKGIDIDDKVNVNEDIKVAKVDGMDYEQTFKEADETELPEIKIEEHSKDWEPELYDRVQKRIEYDSAGRRITPETEEEIAQKNNSSKTQSFLNKVSDVFQSTGVKTIEREVAELQKDPKK
jgi:hypothetical protein